MRALFVKVRGTVLAWIFRRSITRSGFFSVAQHALNFRRSIARTNFSALYSAQQNRRNNMSKVIATPKAPAAVGPYSQAIQVSEVTDIIFTSGQLGLVPETGDFPEGGVEAQARQSLENIKAILAEAGFTMANVVKTTVLLADIADFAKVNAIYAEFFANGALPARSAFQVAALPKGGLVEIEAICAR